MIRFGIVGLGKMGKIRAREIEKNPDTEIGAVFDINEKEMGASGARKCHGLDELLDLPIDAVFVCTYNNVNAEYTIKALEKGKHVFCEKPPARSSSEMEKVIQAEKRSGKTLKYGFNHRYHYSIIEAKKIVDSEMLGKLLWLRGVYGKAGGNQYETNWRNDKLLSGGGILMDQGIHMLDLITHFSGEFVEVKSLVQTLYWKVKVEDNAFALFKTRQGIAGVLHSSATQWRHKFGLDMCFEDGYINLEGILSSTRSYGDEVLVIARKQFEDSTFAFGKPREERIFFDTDDSWKLELDEFVQSIKSNKPIINGSSSDALNIMKVIEKIYDESHFYRK
ncbi:MAG: Gfo/Idh/MocA family oxidoreductase [Candidatus Aminicenantes bacterium]|nr:Gfo/Idh/MocA family oxidoreductase [Candidatus Aminicenantes bacterium]